MIANTTKSLKHHSKEWCTRRSPNLGLSSIYSHELGQWVYKPPPSLPRTSSSHFTRIQVTKNTSARELCGNASLVFKNVLPWCLCFHLCAVKDLRNSQVSFAGFESFEGATNEVRQQQPVIQSHKLARKRRRYRNFPRLRWSYPPPFAAHLGYINSFLLPFNVGVSSLHFLQRVDVLKTAQILTQCAEVLASVF